MIHKIKLYYSTSDADAFHDWLTDWNATKDGNTNDEIDNNIPANTTTPEDSNIEYYRVELTYQSSHDPTVLLQEPYQKLTELCEWARVGYHKCDHDNLKKSHDCSFDDADIDEHGDIPDAISSLSS
jgi:hypothetical protein